MRIALVDGIFPLLSTTFVLDQVTGLLERGHDVQVFAHAPDRPLPKELDNEWRGVEPRVHHWFRGFRRMPMDVLTRTASEVRRAPVSSMTRMVRCWNPVRHGIWGASGYLWCLASEALAHRPFDVVLCHFGENAVTVQRLRRLGVFDVPLATVFHGYDMSRFVDQSGVGVYRELFRHGELMLPISARWARRLEELGCPREKIEVQHLGVDTKAFAFRERHARPDECARLLSVCRLAEKKGVEYAIRALASIRSRSPEFRYDIVGDGLLRSDLEALVAELGLSDRVVFHGARRRDEIAALANAAHLFLAPSVVASDGDQEGIPVAIMEAMASGLPVVSTRHGGIPELVQDGVSGVLVEERDVTGLARALERLLDDRQSWPRLGREGRRVVETEFDLERQNDRLEQRLLALVSAARSKR